MYVYRRMAPRPILIVHVRVGGRGGGGDCNNIREKKQASDALLATPSAIQLKALAGTEMEIL